MKTANKDGIDNASEPKEKQSFTFSKVKTTSNSVISDSTNPTRHGLRTATARSRYPRPIETLKFNFASLQHPPLRNGKQYC